MRLEPVADVGNKIKFIIYNKLKKFRYIVNDNTNNLLRINPLENGVQRAGHSVLHERW